MWLVIKSNKKKSIEILKESIRKKFSSVQFYTPKIRIDEKNDKKKTQLILGKYLFCKHQDFVDESKLTKLKFLRGLEQILTGNIFSQNSIIEFINRCKKYETIDGFLKPNFFNDCFKKNGQFISGPLKNIFFTINKIGKSDLRILVNNIKITVKNDKYFYTSV